MAFATLCRSAANFLGSLLRPLPKLGLAMSECIRVAAPRSSRSIRGNYANRAATSCRSPALMVDTLLPTPSRSAPCKTDTEGVSAWKWDRRRTRRSPSSYSAQYSACFSARPWCSASNISIRKQTAGAIATAQSLTGRSHDVRHSNRRSDGGDNDNKGGK